MESSIPFAMSHESQELEIYHTTHTIPSHHTIKTDHICKREEICPYVQLIRG
jgi:hypothetical protein